MNYYYFAASLPSLALDGTLPLSYADFTASCAAHLSPAHAQAVDALTDESVDSPHPFVKAWRVIDTQIRNDIARLRATRRNADASAFVRADTPFNAEAEKAVTSAFAEQDPLKRERSLDGFRWAQIERLAGFDMFSINAILAYAVKLRLVERWASLSEDRGRARATDLIEQQSKGDH